MRFRDRDWIWNYGLAKAGLIWWLREVTQDAELAESVGREIEDYIKVAMLAGRIDELWKVRAATLDWDTDVWVKTEDGRIISLAERVELLEWSNRIDAPK